MTGLTKEKFVKKINKTKLPLLVEGKNDKKALHNNGVENKIFILNRKPLYKIAEKLSRYDKIILLFDNDTTGRILFKKMNKELTRHGVKINKEFQHLLKKLQVSHVEGL